MYVHFGRLFLMVSRQGKFQTNILKSGFAIGESIPICIDIDNRSERDIERARVQLIQTITYRGARHGARFNFGAGAQNLTHMHVRTGKKVVAQNEEALCVHKEKTGRYTTSLVVPAIMPTFNASVPIQVSYELEASCKLNVERRFVLHARSVACRSR